MKRTQGNNASAPTEGLAYPYPLDLVGFPGSGTPAEELDEVFYVNDNDHTQSSKFFIFDLLPLGSALYGCTTNNPQHPGSFEETLTAEIRDKTDTVTNRITCGIAGSISIETDDDGAVTSATAEASCDNIVYEKLVDTAVINCNSQRIVRTVNGTLLFSAFVPLYGDAVFASGTNYPAAPVRVQTLR